MSTAAAPREVEVSGGSDLAVIVISLRNEPGLVDAVRSLTAQRPRPEIVVVNTGGGDPRATLAGAGLSVPVIDHPEPMFPGAARNLGVRATRAPYVAFLAADCAVEPGWVEARVRRHLDGADAVASVVTNPSPDNPSAITAHLLHYCGRMARTPEAYRLHYGLSYARPVLERVGPFREDLRQGEDTELNGRLAARTTVVWAPEVRTAHRNPLGLRPLVRDQYARGRRSALFSDRAAPVLLWMGLIFRPAYGLYLSLRAGDARERRRILRSAPMLLPATLAYSLGLMRSRLGGPRRATAPVPGRRR